ncbi:MAG: hypothetical protein K6348_04420, partial [Deferribacterales bacterium]
KKMDFMIKRFLFIFLTVIFTLNLNAESVSLEDQNGKTILSLQLQQPTDIIEKKFENNRLIIKLKGEHDFTTNQFFHKYINRVRSYKDSSNTILQIDFEKNPSHFDIKQNANGFVLEFEFPKNEPQTPPETGGNIFLKMIISILFIIVLILVLYWLIKLFMKKTFLNNIPGVGRALGKIDILPGKTVVFYEIKDKVYMFGVSGDNIRLLDKIEDNDTIDAIKAGFSQKADFSSYFRFFSGNTDIKEEIKTSSTIIQDKVESLKKKN